MGKRIGKLTYSLRFVLIMISVFSVISACAAAYTSYAAQSAYSEVSEHHIPLMLKTQVLVRKVERASGQVFLLFTVADEEDHRLATNEWDEQNSLIENDLEAIKDISKAELWMPSALAIKKLISLRTDVLDVIHQRSMVRSAQDNAVLGLKKDQAEFVGIIETMLQSNSGSHEIDLPSINGALIDLRNAITTISVSLLTVPSESRTQHLNLAAVRTSSFLRRVHRILPLLPSEVSNYLGSLVNRISAYGIGIDSIPSLRKREILIDKKVYELRDKIIEVTEKIDTGLINLTHSSQRAFEKLVSKEQKTQSNLLYLVNLFTLFGVCSVAYFSFYYLNKKLEYPVSLISRKIAHFEKTGELTSESELPDNEIGDIGKSFESMAASRLILEGQVDDRNDELAALNASLLKSNHDLDNFAHIASHDLKEPLRGITINTNFMLREDLADALDTRVKRISFLATRMEVLISDLLFYSRLGREQGEKEIINVSNLIDESKLLFEDFVDDRIAKLEIETNLPNVYADTVRLKTVFCNLIANGLKYNRADQKIIKIGFLDNAVIDQITFKNVFYIKDNGIGIDELYHARIFEIFRRLNSEKEFGGGTGAGLSFVKRIINELGGVIVISSTVGKGSTFFFSLPLHQ